MTAIDAIMLACGTWYLSFVITRLDGPFNLFSRARAWRLTKDVATCIYCLSFWIGAALYALLYYEIPEPVYVLGIVGAAHLIAAYTGANYVNGGE